MGVECSIRTVAFHIITFSCKLWHMLSICQGVAIPIHLILLQWIAFLYVMVIVRKLIYDLPIVLGVGGNIAPNIREMCAAFLDLTVSKRKPGKAGCTIHQCCNVHITKRNHILLLYL